MHCPRIGVHVKLGLDKLLQCGNVNASSIGLLPQQLTYLLRNNLLSIDRVLTQLYESHHHAVQAPNCEPQFHRSHDHRPGAANLLPRPPPQISYFTAPPPSPPSINDHADCLLSAQVCLPILTTLINTYDAFLIACYSEHPLVPNLRAEINQLGLAERKFVMGIFEASILHALALVDMASSGTDRWGIVTTGKAWEELLASGVERFLGVQRGLGLGRFAGVVSTGLNATELHGLPKEEVNRRMKEAVRRLLGLGTAEWRVAVVCLGCAGMVRLEETVLEVAREVASGGVVRVVDGVKAGVLMLDGLLKGRYSR